jgi:hypothetical protein
MTTPSVDQLKYNKWLPSFVLANVPAEVAEWKAQLIQGFEKALQNEDWSILSKSIRMFQRYVFLNVIDVC